MIAQEFFLLKLLYIYLRVYMLKCLSYSMEYEGPDMGVQTAQPGKIVVEKLW